MKMIYKLAAVVALAVSMATNSYALLITAGTTAPLATGNETSQAQIDAILGAIMAPGTMELYKGEGVESGPYASSYSYAQNTQAGLLDDDFTITYTGGAMISANPVYLLVKDGNNQPAWYLFDITGWNGTETIQGQNFWPAQGGISHVAIYGKPGTPPSVPDGGLTLALLGASVAGLGLLRRKLS